MASGSFRFDGFELDLAQRRLMRDGAVVELNARYFDALVLLLRESGKLVTKDRFLDEVWRGVPITDEALTQCVKTLRRQLGDDAANPRFIETVPKHGYRFVAAVDRGVEQGSGEPTASTPILPIPSFSWRDVVLLGGAGTIGAGIAGAIGGLFYGFVAASQPLESGGGVSVLFVLLWLTIVVALVGGAGVSFGIAAAGFTRRGWSTIVGGALGGMAIGGIVKLLGLDAFSLLLGRSPGGITGAPEGLLLGGAVGFGAWLAGRPRSASMRRRIAIAGLVGAMGGVLVPLLGGRLMGGSLDLLARTFPGSHLRLGQLGILVGDHDFGLVTRVVTGGVEGALFAACIVGALFRARDRLNVVP
jgi:DNA-binding winged helix-turn-helix (wHTH) protein